MFMKITAFREMKPSSLIEMHKSFAETKELYLHKMAVHYSFST